MQGHTNVKNIHTSILTLQG